MTKYIVHTKEKGLIETSNPHDFVKLKLHNTAGPAFIQHNQDSTYYMYYENNELHRISGPAVIKVGKDKTILYSAWYRHGYKHREDGPAVMDSFKDKYFIKDIEYSKTNFYNEISKRKIKML